MLQSFRTLPAKDRLEFGLVAALLLAGMLATVAVMFF